MNFLRSLLSVAAAVVAIGFPYFFGYGLALHETGPMIASVGFLAVSVVLVVLLSRWGKRRRRQPTPH